MAKFKGVSLVGLATLQGTVFGFIGLLLGIFYSVGGAIYDLMTIGLNAGTAMAFGALVAMPLLAAGAGFVAGGIQAILFNLVARRFSWLQVNLQPEP